MLAENGVVSANPKDTCSLKFTTNVSSCGLLDRAKVRAAAITSFLFRPMLPLLSVHNKANGNRHILMLKESNRPGRAVL